MSTERVESPVGILKGGKRSRDSSHDRGAGLVEDTVGEEAGKPLSRAGSVKKSSSFSRRGTGLLDKRKISFDDSVEVEGGEAGPITEAKQIFAAIADTSLEAGTAGLKQRSSSRER